MKKEYIISDRFRTNFNGHCNPDWDESITIIWFTPDDAIKFKSKKAAEKKLKEILPEIEEEDCGRVMTIIEVYS